MHILWVQACLGTVMFGHNHVRAQTCVGKNVCRHKHVWAQSCGHSRAGTIMYGHKRGGTGKFSLDLGVNMR